MTKLQLIVEICKQMADDLKKDNDRAEAKELSDQEKVSYDPHIIKLVKEK